MTRRSCRQCHELIEVSDEVGNAPEPFVCRRCSLPHDIYMRYVANTTPEPTPDVIEVVVDGVLRDLDLP